MATQTKKIFDGREIEFVEVYDEPNHVHQFHNEYCYCYIAQFKPGETCKWHRHSQDSFYLGLSSGEALNRPENKEEYTHTIKQFDKWWNMAKEKPFVHQVCLLPSCTQPGAFLGMEVLKPPPITSDTPLSAPGYKLNTEYSNSRARIYDLHLDPGQSTGVHTYNFCGVIVSMCDGLLSTEGDHSPFKSDLLMGYGQFKWVEGPVEFSIRNEADTPYDAVVIEWL